MKIELFFTPGCSRCAQAYSELKAAAQQTRGDLIWREVDVLEELDYAVELGVLTLPAMAIDGTLVFSSLPTPDELRKVLAGSVGAA